MNSDKRTQHATTRTGRPGRPDVSRRGAIRLAAAGGAGAMGGLAALASLGCSPHGSDGQAGSPGEAGSWQGAATAPDALPIVAEPITQTPASRARELMANMTLEQKVWQLFVVTPEDLTGYDLVTQAGDATRQALLEQPVGGIAYFGQNVIDPEQTAAMLASTQAYAREISGVPVFLCVDEEGGTVSRVARNDAFGVTDPGNMCDVGATGDPQQAHDVATYIGTYLHDLGFNVDFAPVCDVANNPDSSEMALRSFGADPELVASMVVAQVEGFAETGMLCSAKHFPGIGAAVGDSHVVGITSYSTLDELAAVELVPFVRAIEAGVPMVMVGHISLPTVTGTETPSCLEPQVVTGILREQLGYAGIVITDSLTMAAVSDFYTSADAAVLALQAGVDMLLTPVDMQAAYDGVLAAVSDGRITQERIDASVERVLAAKLGL